MACGRPRDVGILGEGGGIEITLVHVGALVHDTSME